MERSEAEELIKEIRFLVYTDTAMASRLIITYLNPGGRLLGVSQPAEGSFSLEIVGTYKGNTVEVRTVDWRMRVMLEVVPAGLVSVPQSY